MSEREFHKDLRMFLMQLSIYSYEGRDPFAKGLCADALASIPQWIPVSERLPDDGECVLWFNSSWSSPMLVAKRDGESLDWGGDLNCTLHGFTHWMPLPEPPEMK